MYKLEAESLVIRNIKSWIQGCDWLLKNLKSSVLIGCFLIKLLCVLYYQPIRTPDSKLSITNHIAGFNTYVTDFRLEYSYQNPLIYTFRELYTIYIVLTFWMKSWLVMVTMQTTSELSTSYCSFSEFYHQL